jgi:hypothetical protein
MTPIATIEEAIKISKTLCGGDFGIINVFFDSIEERKDFYKNNKIKNNGEWRFITKNNKRTQPSSFSS